MQIINREWVSKDFKLIDNDTVHDFYEFSSMVDKWKHVLVNQFNAKKGSTFGFTICIIDIRYFSLFFACLELGLKLVVYQRPYTYKDIDNYKIKVFKPLDIMVYNDGILNEVTEFFISSTATQSFSIDKTQLNNSIPMHIDVLPDDILLLTTSSGTSDQPKVISHTHKFFYNLSKRNANALSLCKNDRILHIRNMHHGSSVGVFFLPSLLACDNHYYVNFDDENIEVLVQTIEKYKITKLLVPYNKLMNLLAEYLVNNDLKFPNLTVFNLSYLENKWVSLCKANYIKSVTSIFGCNETSGPIFLPSINATTSDNFDNTNVGFLVDDFYKVNILYNSLYVYLETYNKWINTEDLFSTTAYGYVFEGKNRLIRINDVEFSMSEVTSVVQQHVLVEHIVVLDQNNLYLAIFEDTEIVLDILNSYIHATLSPLISISKYAKLNYKDYLYGIKLDQWKIKKYFRDNCD